MVLPLGEEKKQRNVLTVGSKKYRWKRINGKCVRVSRLMMEQHLGRSLKDNEDVHHINGDSLDDRIENLQLMTHSEHSSLTNTGDSHPQWKGDDASDHAKYMREYNKERREGKKRGYRKGK